MERDLLSEDENSSKLEGDDDVMVANLRVYVESLDSCPSEDATTMRSLIVRSQFDETSSL